MPLTHPATDVVLEARVCNFNGISACKNGAFVEVSTKIHRMDRSC